MENLVVCLVVGQLLYLIPFVPIQRWEVSLVIFYDRDLDQRSAHRPLDRRVYYLDKEKVVVITLAFKSFL